MNEKNIIKEFKNELGFDLDIKYNLNPFDFKIYKDKKIVYDYFEDEKGTVLHPVLSIKVKDIKDDSRVHSFNFFNNLFKLLNPSENSKQIYYSINDFFRAYKKYKNKNLATLDYLKTYSRKFKFKMIENYNLDFNPDNHRLIMYGRLDTKEDYKKFNNRDFLIADNTAYLFLDKEMILDYQHSDKDIEKIKMLGKVIKLINKEWFFNGQKIKVTHIDLEGEFI